MNKFYFNFLKKKNFYFIKKNKNIKNHFNFRKNFNLNNLIKKKYKNYLEIGFGEGIINKKLFKIFKKTKIILTEFYKNPLKNFFIKSKKFFNEKKLLIKKKNIFKNLKKKKYNLINFNPPYISYKNKNKKSKKLKFEKVNSLTDFKYGYFFYKKFLKKINKFIKKNIHILIETNSKQKKKLIFFIKKYNFKNIWIK